MAGPYPPNHGYSTSGAQGGAQWYPGQPYPGQQGPGPQQYPETGVPSAYPGMLPPPVQYPKRRRWRVVLGGLLMIALVAAIVGAITFVLRNDANRGSGQLTSASAKTAIQTYLSALSNGDTETVARNNLCGLYDAVKERRSDMALANLSSEAFRKQFSRADVTSIDKIVFASPNQAQVLFSMRVVPAGRSQQPRDEAQGVAQLLAQDNQIFVCSYLQRTAGQY
jgi:hypothetical protein